jgi:hypothetical protein
VNSYTGRLSCGLPGSIEQATMHKAHMECLIQNLVNTIEGIPRDDWVGAEVTGQSKWYENSDYICHLVFLVIHMGNQVRLLLWSNTLYPQIMTATAGPLHMYHMKRCPTVKFLQ